MSLVTPFDGSSDDDDEFFDGRLSPVSTADSEADGIVIVSEAARDVSAAQASAAQAISPRAYQLEMLERSLKGNVIVVMDTGSGKTQVAVMRINIELERASPDKIIWFLATTVSLCEQQFNVIRLQVISVRVKLLTGNDNVETWNKSTWEEALDGTRIIVTTYQVLLDALNNAFVRMDQLSLIIFDEAHNCVGKHPGSKLMKNFYHGRRERGGTLPSVLGLTATPTFNSTPDAVKTLEATLGGPCVTPTLHRETLLSHVKKPTVCIAAFTVSLPLQLTRSMQSLRNAYAELDIHQDPYVLHLVAQPDDKNRRALEKALRTQETYSRDQIKRLCIRCEKILEQLGPWAADTYLWKASKLYQEHLDQMDDHLTDHLFIAERRYVAAFLGRVVPERPPPKPQDQDDISDKAYVLLQQLMLVEGQVVGIIFAKERATVVMLCEFLESCPAIMSRYRIGSMVGSSANLSRSRCLFEFPGTTEQDGLEEFRAGTLNLLVATSVLEEGIDVPACNLVVCFDLPDNHKGFVQRRGRARMHESKLLLLTELSFDASRSLEALECDVNQAFEDDRREIALQLTEDLEPDGEGYFEVQETGAVLDYDNAKQRLGHICNVLSRGEYIDSRPDYILHRHDNTSPTQWSATVLLPSVVPEELRRVDGKSTWLSERNATKEAAFEAYLALYQAGFVNEHLLPFRLNLVPAGETRAAKVDVESSFDPWYHVAESWQSRQEKWLYPLIYEDENRVRSEYEILLPLQVEHFRPMELLLSFGASCQVLFGAAKPVSACHAAALSDHTSTLLAAAFSHRWQVDDRPQVARFQVVGEHISRAQIGSARFDAKNEKHTSGLYLVRDARGAPFRYLGSVPTKPPIELVQHPFPDYHLAPADVPYVMLDKLTKRMDLLSRLHTDPLNVEMEARKPYRWVIPLANALIDEIPMRHAHFGLMIPSIVHELEVMITTKQLATTKLQSVAITDLSLIREARSARCACGPVNYERLEFLGDSILKYCTSVQAAADKPTWPEGYLSEYRDSLVSNSRLCRATLESGLAKFILTRQFASKKWRPLYLDHFAGRSREQTEDARMMSTKTLADVVESLIGASYVDGGLPRAMSCISTFLTECEWHQVDRNRERLFELARGQDSLPPVLEPLERLVGYSFRKKALLIEAMTHGSYALDSGRRSYERLEFLGDAVLDNIIVTTLFSADPPLPHHQMHLLKTAMVNGDFLAFVVMENSPGECEDTVTGGKEALGPIWKYMRHGSYQLGSEQSSMKTRHEALRTKIREAMLEGRRYPWALLARLQAKKFVSDLFEALLGAIWLDSGSTDACRTMIARFGILSYLEFLLMNKTDVRHPKLELGQWAGRQKVKYEVDIAGDDSNKCRYICRVLVGDTVVGTVEDGLSPEEAQTRAADEFMRRIWAEREELDSGLEVNMSDDTL